MHDKSVKIEEKKFVPESPRDYGSDAAPVKNAKKPKEKRNMYTPRDSKRLRETRVTSLCDEC